MIHSVCAATEISRQPIITPHQQRDFVKTDSQQDRETSWICSNISLISQMSAFTCCSSVLVFVYVCLNVIFFHTVSLSLPLSESLSSLSMAPLSLSIYSHSPSLLFITYTAHVSLISEPLCFLSVIQSSPVSFSVLLTLFCYLLILFFLLSDFITFKV